MAVIYKITNTITGKHYIGHTEQNPEERWKSHKRRALNSNSPSKLHVAIREDGWENFTKEVLIIEDDAKYCKNVLEPKYIQEYNSFENGYNMTLGGEGNVGADVSRETREKMSEAHSGEKNAFFGKTHTEESKQLMSEKRKNDNL